jgi:hypothetical protein
MAQATHSPSHSSRSISPSGSPAAGAPDTPSKDKIGVPVFREENGQRRLHLIVDMGQTFKPEDIVVQVSYCRESRLQQQFSACASCHFQYRNKHFNEDHDSLLYLI